MIAEWVAQTQIYPPAHIYAGMPQAKPEKQAISVCEFNFGQKRNVLGDLRSAWRELEVLAKLHAEGLNFKPEYLDKAFGEFILIAADAITSLDQVFKKHQAVNEYYKTWRVSYQNIKIAALSMKHSLS